MNTSEAGQEFIRGFEQCRLVAYKPTPNDVWTCGWGSTEGVTEETVWTQEEADERFARDLAVYERCVEDHVTVEITQDQFDALVSLCFNIGCKAFRNSTLLRRLNEGDYFTAARHFTDWNKQKGKELAGLTRRREAEADVFRRSA
jgi:lysozyme